LENANVNKKLSRFVFSDTNRRLTLIAISIFGIILITISFLGNSEFYHFFLALGVSLIVGTLIGFYVGNKIGWPMGFWVGLIGGLIVAPLVVLIFGNGVAAYYASFLGPTVGGLVGKWAELKDKRRLEEGMDRITK